MAQSKNNINQAKTKPPNWAQRFLHWYCAPDLLEEVEGDILEIFHVAAAQHGAQKANWVFIGQVFRFFNYSTIKGNRRFQFQQNTQAMLQNYLKISIRNLLKNRLSSSINILGLALGFACFMLIGLFVQDELSYDRFYDEANNIYRVTVENFNEDGTKVRHWVAASPRFVPLLVQDYAAIKTGTRIYVWDNPILISGEKKIMEENMIYAEPEFFKLFNQEFVEGNAETALKEPNSIVLTEVAADRYFTSDWRDKGLVGKSISYNNEFPLKITGIIKDIPEQSHLQFEVIITFQTIVDLYGGEESVQSTVGNFNFPSYVLLNEDADVNVLNAQMEAFGKKYIPDRNGRVFSDIFKVKLEPLTDIHLKSNSTTEYSDNGNYQHIMIFGIAGLMILLIACINYMNLSTARYTQRLKEVGVRKVMGARRGQLVTQFLTESILLTVLAFIVALLMVWYSLPHLNDFTGKHLGLFNTEGIEDIFALISIVLVVGLLSGSYPALFLSSFRPISTLKQEKHRFSKSAMFRAVLVVFQFTVSMALISSLGIVQDQLDYIQTKNLGFSKDQIVQFRTNRAIREKWETFKTQIRDIPGVIGVTASSRIPTGELSDSMSARFVKNGEEEILNFRLAMVRIDPNFFDTYDINLAAGRQISDAFASDSLSSYILNETAVKALGFEDVSKVIGERFRYGNQMGTIIGVAEDFHFESLHSEIAPIIFYAATERYYRASVKISTENVTAVVSELNKLYKTYEKEYPFNYSFIDEEFDRRYRSEMRLGKLFSLFACLAVLIASMGLLGLASFSAERRIKEIGIRKILGANSSSILALLSTRFAKLLGIALIFALPLTWFFMQNWLKEFAYHTSINLPTLMSGGIIAFLVAIATILWSTSNALSAKPVDVLKNE